MPQELLQNQNSPAFFSLGRWGGGLCVLIVLSMLLLCGLDISVAALEGTVSGVLLSAAHVAGDASIQTKEEPAAAPETRFIQLSRSRLHCCWDGPCGRSVQINDLTF